MILDPDSTAPMSGCVSFCRWDSPELQAAFARIFHLQASERFTEIRATREGLCAFFDPS